MLPFGHSRPNVRREAEARLSNNERRFLKSLITTSVGLVPNRDNKAQTGISVMPK